MLSRLTARDKRHALTGPNLAYAWWRFGANGIRTCRALFTPVSHDDVAAIALELTDHGIAVGPSDRFLADDGRRALVEVADQILQASRSEAVEAIVTGAAVCTDTKKQFRVDLVAPSDGVSADSALLKLAVDEKLLEIVAGYLGLWPSLHSIGAWLNYPTNTPAESSQLWHRDPEDLKIIKVFIYLTDVDEQCGPFTYIPRTHPFGAAADKVLKKGVSDDHMSQMFPPTLWRMCTGPAYSMILADTLGYHRGGKPRLGRRTLVTFTYTSGVPLTKCPLWIKGEPAWNPTSIQRYALKDLPQGENKKAALANRKTKKK